MIVSLPSRILSAQSVSFLLLVICVAGALHGASVWALTGTSWETRTFDWWAQGPMDGSALSLGYLSSALTHVLFVMWALFYKIGELSSAWKTTVYRMGSFPKWYRKVICRLLVLSTTYWASVALLVAIPSIWINRDTLMMFSPGGSYSASAMFLVGSICQSVIYVQFVLLADCMRLRRGVFDAAFYLAVIVAGLISVDFVGFSPFAIGTTAVQNASLFELSPILAGSLWITLLAYLSRVAFVERFFA